MPNLINIDTIRKFGYLKSRTNVLKVINYGKSRKKRDGFAICYGVFKKQWLPSELDELKMEGKIKKANQLARGILLNREIPILGKIKAGTPVTSEENIEGYINLDSLTNIQNSFFLKVDGDSMKNAGILDGDLALIKQQSVLNNNEIGAFRINGEVTLKRIKIDKNKIILRPENENYEDIIINETDNFEVIGKLIYVLKDFRDK
ncbi:MAG: lexA [Deferribacteraceae bacterium]|nr:lexA [Deferribacteraceae bacterium]